MAADEPLCTPADVINVRPTFASLPATEQQSLCDVASQKILNYCRRSFKSSMKNEWYNGNNQSRLWLRCRPVISVQQIIMNDELLDNSNNEAWTFVPETGELIRGIGLGHSRFARWWLAGLQNINVQYWAGYDTLPDPIVRAAIFEALFLLQRSKISGLYSGETLGDYSYTLAAQATYWGLPGSVLDLLVDYVQDDGPL